MYSLAVAILRTTAVGRTARNPFAIAILPGGGGDRDHRLWVRGLGFASDPPFVPAPRPQGNPTLAHVRRLRWIATIAAATVSLWLFLRYLAGVAAQDAEVLPVLVAPVRTLSRVGGWVTGLITGHFWLAAAAVLASAVIAASVVAREKRSTTRRDLASISFCSLSAFAVVFLAGQLFVAAALAAAAAGGALLVRGTDGNVERRRSSRFFVLVPLALGLILRLADVAQYPPGYAEHAAVHHAGLSIPIYEDLGKCVLHADWTALQRVWRLVVTDQHGPSSLVEALGFSVFGVNMTATRLTSAILGTFTILLAYGVGSRLAGPRAGLLFALLLAIVPWHVSISRYEDTEHVLSPLQALATVYFVLGTVRRGRWRDFLGLGAALGLSWYLYSPNQTLPLIVAAVVVTALVENRSFLNGRGVRTFLAAVCFVVVSYPAVSVFVQHGRMLPVRSGYQDNVDSRFLSPERLSRMTRDELAQSFVRAEDPWFSKPGGGLSLVSCALLLPGLAWCATRMRGRQARVEAVLFLVGLPAAFLPAVLAPDASFRRLLLFALLALMLTSLVLDRVIEWFLAAARPRVLAVSALALLAAGGVATSAHAYFDLTHVSETESHRYHQELARFVNARLGSRYMTIVARDLDVDDVNRYIGLAAYRTLSDIATRGVPGSAVYRVVKFSEATSSLPWAQTIRGHALLLVEQSLVHQPLQGTDLWNLAARRFPGARASVWRAGDGNELFTWWEFEAHPGGTGG